MRQPFIEEGVTWQVATVAMHNDSNDQCLQWGNRATASSQGRMAREGTRTRKEARSKSLRSMTH